ncbi:MAG: hypothetical protein C4576_10125 [Desulfobacteraceae bacterium]|nr:MAG: hypothetical protein C4576_10125 [Desulfobacteraceae bacterium]
MTDEASNLYMRVFFVLGFAWFASWVGLNMQSLGFRIEQPNLALDYTMGVLWWFVFAAVILSFRGESRRLLMIAWTVKFIVVLVLMLFYEQRYGLDAYTYFGATRTGQHWMYAGVDFRDDMIPVFRPVYHTISGYPLLEGEEGGSLGTENFLRFILIVSMLTGPFYHAIKVAFAFMGLLGVWFFYRAVVVGIGQPNSTIFYLLAFFPSILFWSSILGKDPLQFLFLGLYSYGTAIWLVERRLGASPWIVVGLAGAYMLRPWISVMGGAALIFATLLGRCRAWQVGIMFVFALPILVYVGQKTLSVFVMGGPDIDLVLNSMQTISSGYASDAGSGDKDVGGSAADSADVSWPVAFFAGLFRPLPFDITNPFTALAAVENTVVLLLAVVALFRCRLGYLRDPLILWPLLYTLMWAGTHGFIVLVNFGSGVRYKLQMWPFFLLFLACLTHKEGRRFLDSRQEAWNGRRESLKPNRLRAHSPA